MARTCASCASPNAVEINRKLRSGTTNEDVSRWLTEVADPITPHAIGRHARAHLGVAPVRGPRPMSADFAQAVVDRVAEKMAAGDLEPDIGHGLKAQAILDGRSARNADRDLMARVALALTARVRIVSPEVEALEGEYRQLLSGE